MCVERIKCGQVWDVCVSTHISCCVQKHSEGCLDMFRLTNTHTVKTVVVEINST